VGPGIAVKGRETLTQTGVAEIYTGIMFGTVYFWWRVMWYKYSRSHAVQKSLAVQPRAV
jgi:hypothetical protein